MTVAQEAALEALVEHPRRRGGKIEYHPALLWQLADVRAHEPLTLPFRTEPRVAPTMPAYPADDRGVTLLVPPRWRKLAWQQREALRQSGYQLQTRYGTTDVQQRLIAGKLGEIAVWQYLLNLGIPATLPALKLTPAAYAAYVPERDSADLCVRKLAFDVKTAQRAACITPALLRSRVAHYPTRFLALHPQTRHLIFCSYAVESSEEYVQVMGWCGVDQLPYIGSRVAAGACAPDDDFPQRTENWVIPYQALNAPNTLR